MANTYNPYLDIQKVYNAKVAWNNATTDEERKRQNELATSARKTLEAYGYGDVANQISASGADATTARKIMEQYAPTVTVTPSTNDTDTELITKHNNEIRNKTNQLWGIQENDRNVMAEKYNKLEDTAYSDPFTTDEAKAILGKYDLAGLQGRNNAVAKGGASNGGNIDSYAAANAMRQQASLVNQGQMAVLEAHNNKLNGVKSILESLGVYQQNQDKGMQNTITLQQGESQRLFDNGETAKNNDVARKVEISNVTGYSPDEWVVSNNPYMNDDGTIKDQYKNIDFSTVMAKAKAAGNTSAYNAAATARYYKIMSDYGAYGQYDDGNYIVPGTSPTEARRQFDETSSNKKYEIDANNDIILKTLGIESADKRYVADKNAEANIYKALTDASVPTLTASQAATAIKNGEISQGVIDAYNYYYKTNYTVENPPKIKNDKGNPPLTDDEVTSWVDYLNNEVANEFGEGKTAVMQDGKDKYKRGDVDADYIIINIFKSADLTQEQKEYLLYDKFGITEDQVNAVLNDPHYK